MMTAGPSSSGPGDPPEVPRADQIVLLLCSDISDTGPCPVPTAQVAAAVRGRVPGARVLAVRNLCSGVGRLPAALPALGARRVIVGCRNAAARREEITARLRKAGIQPAGIGVVDLLPAGQPDHLRVIEQSAGRLHAAIARVSHADLAAPVRERPVRPGGPVSRRALFHPGTITSRPVASWIESRCRGGECCRLCASACQHDALRLTGSGVLVEAGACTGCGACLAACRPGAISLAGWSMGELGAAAGILIAEALRPGPGQVHGVVIVCALAAAQVPVGADWLPLEVPSLEMVSAGWLLQILSAGTGVALAGCDDYACASRGRELDQFCAALAEEASLGWRRRSGQFAGWQPAHPSRPERNTAGHAAPIELREPAATASALSSLGLGQSPAISKRSTAAPSSRPTGAGKEQWRLESQAAPLGEITVDASRCSGCGICALTCPTAALTAACQDGSALVLSVNAAECSACGACVSACPEKAVSLRRVLDPANLAADRHQLAEIVAGGQCESCGRPLASGLASSVVALRLAASHPRIAARLRQERRCTDCLLIASDLIPLKLAVRRD